LTMLAPLLAFFLFMLAVEKRQVVLGQGIPMLLVGCIGNAAGALIGSAIGRVCQRKAARKNASAGMAFFVVGDQMGIHVYRYDETSKIQLRPGEVLVGRAGTLEEAQLIQSETDPLSVRPPVEG
jgi:dolichol kinase